MERTTFKPKGKSLNIIQRVKSACVVCIFTPVILNTNIQIFVRSSIKKAESSLCQSQQRFKSDKAISISRQELFPIGK